MNEKFSYGLVYGSVIITIGILFSILFYIFFQGTSSLSLDLLTTTSSEKVEYVIVENLKPRDIAFTNETTYLKVNNFNNEDVTVLNKQGEIVTLPSEFKINTLDNEPVTYLTEQ